MHGVTKQTNKQIHIYQIFSDRQLSMEQQKNHIKGSSLWQATQYEIPDDASPHPPLCGRPHRHPLSGEFDRLLFVLSSLISDRMSNNFITFIFTFSLTKSDRWTSRNWWSSENHIFFIKVIFNMIWLPMPHWDSQICNFSFWKKNFICFFASTNHILSIFCKLLAFNIAHCIPFYLYNDIWHKAILDSLRNCVDGNSFLAGRRHHLQDHGLFQVSFSNFF